MPRKRSPARLAACAAALAACCPAEALAWDAGTAARPIEARFARRDQDLDRLAQLLGTALGARVETDAGTPNPALRMPAAYKGDVDGLLRAIACLNGLVRSYPAPGVVRFSRPAGGADAACLERRA